MCYSCNCCGCCAPPPPYYPQTIVQSSSPNHVDYKTSTREPPVPDETWHHGYTFCNCQECCDCRDCCDCSGICYDCNVGHNSVPLYNSNVGPLYQYYGGACCRSCLAAQYSGASCLESLFPCWLNSQIVLNQQPPYQPQTMYSVPNTGNISYTPVLTLTPTSVQLKPTNIIDFSPTPLAVVPAVPTGPFTRSIVQPAMMPIRANTGIVPRPSPVIQSPVVYPARVLTVTRTV